MEQVYGPFGSVFEVKLFADLVTQWKTTHIYNEKKPPKYFLVHARMLGAVERGTSERMILFPSPFKLVAASGKPPPESLDEIRHVRILRQVRSGCQLMADGAMGWSGAAKEERKGRKVKIRVTHVKHSQGQFTRKVAARLRRNRLGGTQVLDRMWDSLKRILPRSLSTRTLSEDSLRLRLQR